MGFSDNIKYLRKNSGMTQKELAENLGITARTLQNYEMGTCLPKKASTARRISEYFGVSMSSLFSAEDYYVIEAGIREGSKAQRELKLVLSELTALFEGGRLSEPDKELVMRTMNEIYWDSKEKARQKYAAKSKIQTKEDD